MNKEGLIRYTPHPPEHQDSSLNTSKSEHKINKLLELPRHVSMINTSKNNSAKKMINKIKNQLKGLSGEARHVKSPPKIEEPSKNQEDLLSNFLTKYQVELNKSEEEPELSIAEVIRKAIKTGVPCGKNIEIRYNEETLRVPQTIGIINTELFIKVIQFMHKEHREFSEHKKTINANAVAKIVDQQPPSIRNIPSPEESHLPLINTKRHSHPLRKYKPFFHANNSTTTKEKQTATNELETSPRFSVQTWAHI